MIRIALEKHLTATPQPAVEAGIEVNDRFTQEAKDDINKCRFHYNEWMKKIADLVNDFVEKNQEPKII